MLLSHAESAETNLATAYDAQFNEVRRDSRGAKNEHNGQSLGVNHTWYLIDCIAKINLIPDTFNDNNKICDQLHISSEVDQDKSRAFSFR